MLQLIRDNAQGVIIWIIVILVVLGLSSFILSSYLGGGAKNYVASVNDVEISNRQFQIAFNNRQAQLQQQLGDNFARFFNEKLLRTSVVTGLVESELLTQLVLDAGFRNSAEQARKSLEKIPAFQDESGKFSNKKFSNMVAQFGYTAESYALEQAISLSKQQYVDGISTSAFTLKSSVTDFQRLTRQQRDMGYLTLNRALISQSIEVSEQDTREWYEQHAGEYMTQEQVSVDYIELSMKDLAAKQEIDEDLIRQFYENNKASYSKDDYSKAEKKIKAVARRLSKGESFEKLAKEVSEDPGTARNGGDLGFFGKGIMDPAFEKAVYQLNKGQVSEPIKSQFGYHLIRLEDIDGDQRRARHILIKKGSITKSYDEAKAVIENTLKSQEAERVFYEGQTALENLTYQHQDSLEPAAEALGVSIKTSPLFSRTGGAQMFRNPDLVREAFSEEVLHESLNSNLIKLSEDHLVVIRLKQHVPAKQKELEEVKSLVESQLKNERARQHIEELSGKLVEQLAEGKTVESILSEHKSVTWNNPGFIGREARYDTVSADKGAPASVDREVRAALFTMKKPVAGKAAYHAVTAGNGDGVVIVLRAVRDNPKQEEQSVLDSMQQQMTQTRARADVDSIIEFMRSRSDVEIVAQQEEDEI
jgi:peptidyl-prolyl cis-trans isomerase D